MPRQLSGPRLPIVSHELEAIPDDSAIISIFSGVGKDSRTPATALARTAEAIERERKEAAEKRERELAAVGRPAGGPHP